MKARLLPLIAILAGLLTSAPPVLAASCNGASHTITLTNGAATPGSGTTSTPIAFSVRYADSEGCAPDSVTVTISGVGTRTMSGAGASYATGVVFRATVTLPAGSHSYTFAASSGNKSATLSSVSPARVVISAPTPVPTLPPTPRPTLKPTPPPPPPPTPAPPPPPTPAPTVPPTPVVTATPVVTPTATQSPSAVPSNSDGGTPSAGPSVTPTETAAPSGSGLVAPPSSGP